MVYGTTAFDKYEKETYFIINFLNKKILYVHLYLKVKDSIIKHFM